MSSRAVRQVWRVGRGFLAVLLAMTVVAGTASRSDAADPDLNALRKLLRSGDYDRVIQSSTDAINRRTFGEDWYLMKIEAQLATGDYAEAWQTVNAGLQRYNWSIRLRQRGIEAARHASQVDRATAWQAEILDLAGRAPWRYTDSDSLIALGRTALAHGLDARQVLEQLLDRALKQSPKHRDAWLAIGEMALDKQDLQLAAATFRTAVEEYPSDPDLLLGLARSLEFSEPQRAAGAVAQALQANPKHVPSMVYRAERAIDAERYLDATHLLDQAIEVHPTHPDVWAFQAVIARLSNNPKGAVEAREQALKTWPGNPRVDFLIGRKLSQKYLFAEGAEQQKTALRLEPDYLPARTQLVHDLLRLGRDDEGWRLAEAVHAKDGYDVQIFNLLDLRDKLEKFTTLESDDFLVRMDAREAMIYGDDVVALLQRARQTLCAKYGLKLGGPITVEIYPEPADFAVKTFGLPGVSGFLGVCFGKLITANSPASQADQPANWQAVLWHEFCHVVTLELTRNQMPRWLSEGISVYEERLADPAWGQRMTPVYRQWILSGQLTPLDEMSGAFLAPPTGQHLQFAYYQSSLVVEFLVEVYGIERLRDVLSDLAAGVPVNTALERRIATVEQLDQEFQDFAKEQARQFGPQLDWEEYDLSAVISDDDPQRLAGWVAEHQDSVTGLTALIRQYVERREWPNALPLAERLIAAAPEFAGPGSFYPLLAQIHRQMGDTQAERRVLEDYTQRADAALPALIRLMELQRVMKSWPELLTTVDRVRAVNPLLPGVARVAAEAAEATQRPDAAIVAWRSQLALGTDDRAEAYYRLARLWHAQGDPRARRTVIEALEVAPRYRDAQRLLLAIVDESEGPASALRPANGVAAAAEEP